MSPLPKTAIASAVLLHATLSFALPPWSSLGEAVAIQGYDPVAYFTENAARRGSSKFVADHQGMSWFFSSQENRELFVANPEKYTPQFGGFCTVSVAGGKSARGSGDSWTIREGKLYLNYNKDVTATFLGDPGGYISKALGWWPTLKSRMEGQ